MERVGRKGNIREINSEISRKTALKEASHVLLKGGVVAFPTESFYGLAVDVRNKEAIEKLFSLKQRDRNNPMLMLLPEVEDLKNYVADIPEQANKLIKAFWPGGLTIVFRAGRGISPLLTADTGKIGVRFSSHPVAADLARSIGRPITGTSANLSGRPPCINADMVYDSFGESIDLILDNGPTAGGKGSTILDVTVDPFVVIREGMVLKKDIGDVILFNPVALS
ncbi:MAG: threonylcarbamoyl-AMP synthase [Deltaproteobacteria bacterium]|nr:threonylcarbamoyl-AMP synthase [Deltaproteobacteria bacterium]